VSAPHTAKLIVLAAYWLQQKLSVGHLFPSIVVLERMSLGIAAQSHAIVTEGFRWFSEPLEKKFWKRDS
jgi:hypothetical protein